MYRCDHVTGSTVLPPPSAPTATPDRFFFGGDQAGQVLATVVEAEWLNMLQEEIANVVTDNGAIPNALNKAARNQLLLGVRREAQAAVGNFVLRTGDTMTGQLRVSGTADFATGTGLNQLEIVAPSGSEAVIAFHRETLMAIKMGLNAANAFTIGGWSWASDRLTLSAVGDLRAANNVTAAGNLATEGGTLWSPTTISLVPASGEAVAYGQLRATAAVLGETGVFFAPTARSFSAYWDGGVAHYLHFWPQWYWVFDGSNGYLTWQQPGGAYVQFPPGGGVATNGTISGGYVASSGNINAAGTYTGNAVSVGYIYDGGNLDVAGTAGITGNLNVVGSVNSPNGNFWNNVTSGYGQFSVAAITNGGIVYSLWGTAQFAFSWQPPNLFTTVDGTGILVGVLSDERAKQDIEPSRFDCLAAVRAIPLWQYRWRNLPNLALEATEPADDDAPLIPVGFVAQRLAAVFPQGVHAGHETQAWSIDSDIMLAALCGAVQRLADQVDRLNQHAA